MLVPLQDCPTLGTEAWENIGWRVFKEGSLWLFIQESDVFPLTLASEFQSDDAQGTSDVGVTLEVKDIN